MPIPRVEGLAVDGYFYNVSDLVNIWWGDGKYTFAGKWAPYIAVQGGTESNAGQSFVGKVDSQDFGAQIGFNPYRGVAVHCRLRSDSVEDRYGQSAHGRNLQQLQLPDLS